MPEIQEENSEIQFSEARNGEMTCSFLGKFLHSKYDPGAEAKRFSESLNAEFEPECVFLIEPALSYCLPFLRKRFPNVLLCAIRILDGFPETCGKWDRTFRFSQELADEIFGEFGEEKICSSVFFEWGASAKIFGRETAEIWKSIREVVVKAGSVMATRAFFSRRWAKNAAIFASRIKRTAKIEGAGGFFPVLVAASGPSLEKSVRFIKKFREKFFLIAVSSSVYPLSSRKVEPDLVLSTDGGYWAKRHIEFPGGGKSEIPLALPPEAAAPGKILHERAVVPLMYDDAGGYQGRILARLGADFTIARRNGTVSGTALELALSLTRGPVFLCGLDQEGATGFQHTMPNALEDESADGRLSSKETRITASRFSSEGSLKIYREWFSANSKKFNSPVERVFRISDGFCFRFGLGKIRDVDWGEFGEILRRFPVGGKIGIAGGTEIKIPAEERRKIVLEEFNRAMEDEKSVSEFFPMDFLLLNREKNVEKRLEIRRKIGEKSKKLMEEVAERIR